MDTRSFYKPANPLLTQQTVSKHWRYTCVFHKEVVSHSWNTTQTSTNSGIWIFRYYNSLATSHYKPVANFQTWCNRFRSKETERVKSSAVTEHSGIPPSACLYWKRGTVPLQRLPADSGRPGNPFPSSGSDRWFHLPWETPYRPPGMPGLLTALSAVPKQQT